MDYIDREKLLEELRAESDLNNGDDLKEIQILSIVGKAPTEDVAPIKHGKWIAKDVMIKTLFARNYYCSECGHSPIECLSYCGNCSAKMDLESGD